MEDNTIECPNCGEVFSLEFTRCPKCGLNMYPEDEPAGAAPGMQPDEAEGRSPGAGEAVLAVILGLILAGTLSFIVHMFASRTATGTGLPETWRIGLLMASPLGAVVGGYSMGLVGQHGRMAGAGAGALVGAGCAALAVLFETRWRLVTPQVLVEPSMLAMYALCILGGAVGGWLSGKSEAAFLAGGTAPAKKEAKGVSWEDLMYRDLLTRVRYNRDTAERLIEFERRKTPEADRYTLIRNAVERLERDRGG